MNTIQTKYEPSNSMSKRNSSKTFIARAILFSFSLFLLSFSAQAQTDEEIADAAFENREYATVLPMYLKFIARSKSNKGLADMTFKVAECYRHTGKLKDALSWYDKAKARGWANPNYLFHQGNIHLRLGEYENAKGKFQAFLEQVPGDKDATRLLNNCNTALNTVPEPMIYTLINETSLNSRFNDYAPQPIGDKVYFTSSRIEATDKIYSYDGEAFSDVFMSSYQKDDKMWSKPKKVEALNTPFNEGVLTYSDKTKTGYFNKCNDNKSKTSFCSIAESSYDESTGTWSAPKLISLSSKQTVDMQHPAISPDGKLLFFCAKMEDGKGGSDIWVMRKNGEEWGEPKNLGDNVNTELDETFPVARENELFFSSNGHPGFGGQDIYSTTQSSDGVWGKPTHLKVPFNSPDDDFFLVYTNAEKTSGYFTSNRLGGAGGDDVYNFFLTPVNLVVKGRVTDVDNTSPLAGARVILTAADGTTDSTFTNANGEYSFNLSKNQDYKINVITPGYFGDSKKLTTQGEMFSKEFSKATGHNYDFSIKRIPKEEIKIEDIYYDYDSDSLREESKPSLDKLAKLLEDTPEALVQINSHTDERGKLDYNMKLSENRAKSVVVYLVSKGINPTRLTSKGFASTQPVVKNAKDEDGHQKNRRTTFQVLKND